jgi:hypothetical protein
MRNAEWARAGRRGGLLTRPLSSAAIRSLLALLLLSAWPLVAHGQSHSGPDDHHPDEVEPEGDHDHTGHPPHGSLANVGAKLSNPVSDVWALFTQFGLTFSDGDANKGDAKVGGNVVFQPILPFPLYGEGDDAWKMITRPAIPLLLGQPVPRADAFDSFSHLTGLGDTQLPLIVSPPTGNWLLGLGPTFLLPTATQDKLASNQWSMGPALVLGYKTPKWTAVVFPQWNFSVGSAGQGSRPNVNSLSMLYSFSYNLPDAWQIITNPTLTYDRRAKGSNAWNVPIGLGVAKTLKIGRTPTKIQFAFEYSVVHQDDFGQRFQVKLNIIPVIQSLVKSPIF